jgi:hypothetical protein
VRAKAGAQFEIICFAASPWFCHAAAAAALPTASTSKTALLTHRLVVDGFSTGTPMSSVAVARNVVSTVGTAAAAPSAAHAC